MLEQVKIITSRRSYEFGADDLRLSMLSVKPLQEQIQQLFHFQASTMGSPVATFGEVPATYPPGMVFDMGVWVSPEKQMVPIRFLHFEQRRIVIDVAGPSSAITAIYDHLRQFLAPIHAADGSPVISEPEQVLDYTEITARFPFSLDAFIAPAVRNLLSRISGIQGRRKNLILAPTLAWQVQSANEELAAVAGPNDTSSFSFALRSGTRPEEHIYFSGAPLDSDAHLAYLTELEAALSV
jgi:hypothetical protein